MENERLLSRLPRLNKRILFVLASIMILIGVSLIVIQEDMRIGEMVFILGVFVLVMTVFLSMRKVEIVGNCGFCRSFFKKRFFYLSEIKEINISPQNDRMVVSGVDGTQIFDISRANGCFDEIEQTIKKMNSDIVTEKEPENNKTCLWAESVSRIVLYFILVVNIVTYVSNEYTEIMLGALVIVFLVRVLVMSYINNTEDTILLDEGQLIEDAILVNYMNNELGSAYPIFEFNDKEGKHIMYAKTKMKMKDIERGMKNVHSVYYAAGKAMAVKVKMEEDE